MVAGLYGPVEVRFYKLGEKPLGGVPEESAAPAARPFLPINVLVDGDDYLISATVPGVRREEISISLVGNAVIIEITPAAQQVKGKYIIQEYSVRSGQRKISLPGPISQNSMQARLEGGELTIRVQNDARAAKTKIKID